MIPMMSDNAAIWRQQAPGDRPLAAKLAVEPGFGRAWPHYPKRHVTEYLKFPA
jgi:hypothetical protein